MGCEINDLWIIHTNGTVIYSKINTQNFDKEIIGSFVAAMNTFAKEFAKGDLNNINIGNSRFYMMKLMDFLFVANTKNNSEPKQVGKKIRANITKFVTQFPTNMLRYWEDNLEFFDSFKPDLEEKCDEPIDKLRSSLW